MTIADAVKIQTVIAEAVISHDPVISLAESQDMAFEIVVALRAAGFQIDQTGHDVTKDVLASLVAAVSLLKRGSKKAAPSDRMFDQMIADYERSIERGRAALKERR